MLLAMDLADAGVKLWRQPNPPTPPRSIASLYSSSCHRALVHLLEAGPCSLGVWATAGLIGSEVGESVRPSSSTARGHRSAANSTTYHYTTGADDVYHRLC